MPAKKKTAKRTVSVKKPVSSPSKPLVATNNTSLLFLAVACAVLAGAYLLFSSTVGNPKVMYPDYVMPTATVTPLDSMKPVIVLNEQNNSGEYGNATLNEVNGKVVVKLDVKNAPRGVMQPAHIHMGTCIALGGVKYPLKNVVNGVSETTLNVSMKELKKQGPISINVHKSTSQSNVYVACGNVN